MFSFDVIPSFCFYFAVDIPKLVNGKQSQKLKADADNNNQNKKSKEKKTESKIVEDKDDKKSLEKKNDKKLDTKKENTVSRGVFLEYLYLDNEKMALYLAPAHLLIFNTPRLAFFD